MVVIVIGAHVRKRIRHFQLGEAGPNFFVLTTSDAPLCPFRLN